MPKANKPWAFDGDKEQFSDWFAHVLAYWAYYDQATEKQKVLATCGYMNAGAARTWSRAYCKRFLSQSQHAWSWDHFVAELKDMYGPLNEPADAQARLRLFTQDSTPTEQYLITLLQIATEAEYTEVKANTPEADHLIDLLKTNMNPTIVYTTEDSRNMTKTRDYNAFVRALKDVGKAVETRYGGKVPPRTTTRSAAPPMPRLAPPLQRPLPHETPATSPTVAPAPADRRDATGMTYGGTGQPMDLGRTRRPRLCFNCSEPGHFAKECPKPRSSRPVQVRNIILDFDEEEKREYEGNEDF